MVAMTPVAIKTANSVKLTCDTRGTSNTVPSHWPCCSATTSERNSCGSCSRLSSHGLGEISDTGSCLHPKLPNFKCHLDHVSHSPYRNNLSKSRIEEVLQQRRPGSLEVESGRINDCLRSGH